MGPEHKSYDILIVGGGPGGMAAAIWCADLGLNSCLVEKETRLGGQLKSIFNPIRNYPGIEAEDGAELLALFESTMPDKLSTRLIGRAADEIDLSERSVRLADGTRLIGRTIILSTGIRRRKLGVSGETEFHGSGILESGFRDRMSTAGERVAVIGGGDAALENALILSGFAETVFLIHRGHEFSGRREFIDAVKASDRIKIILQSEVMAFLGAEHLESLKISTSGGSLTEIRISKAIVRIGVEPNSELVRDQLKCDEKGFVVVDHKAQTSVRGVYAIGDLSYPSAPTVSTAAGSAAIAVKSAVEYLLKNDR